MATLQKSLLAAVIISVPAIAFADTKPKKLEMRLQQEQDIKAAQRARIANIEEKLANNQGNQAKLEALEASLRDKVQETKDKIDKIQEKLASN